MKASAVALAVGLAVVLVSAGCGSDSSDAQPDGADAGTPTQAAPTTAAATTIASPATHSSVSPSTTPAPTTKALPPKPPNRRQIVRDALGDEVQAGGYAGDVKILDVSFADSEAQVTARTPEGGFEGASCGDLDDGAQAIFKTIYDDGAWKGSAVLVYQGGLVDSSTGKDLPDVNTGIFTMPAIKARQIEWSDDDGLFGIDWSLYRDFCHPALQ
jgi:hypothetical protein